ncbi:MAG: hypothetical protein Athens041674_722 [Parcubacteria group bacterium Athens0416_74]|nr:MAG: hypothetical protein Athens041674_722 [Parcubacteria group bacterium Athens0416_74]
MDEIKDIQRTDSVSRFIDQHSVRTNPFGENRAADRAYRRAERIAAGLHMLTNHISEQEPVRSEVRSTASLVLLDVLKLRDEMRSAHSHSVAELQGRVRYLISMVRIMGVSGFVSQQNATTVIEALDELGTYVIASQRSMLSENISLSREDLIDVRMPTYRPVQPRPVKDMSDIKDTKDVHLIKDSHETSVRNGDSVGALSVRVQSILEILKVGGSLGIKDISANLPEYSEKMIQRELLELVTRGAIKKTGLKRWSKYSLVA